MSRFSILVSTVFGIAVCKIFDVSVLPVLVLGTVLLSASVYAATRSRTALGVGITVAATGAAVDILCSATLAAAPQGMQGAIPEIVVRSSWALGVLSVLALILLMGLTPSGEQCGSRHPRWRAPDTAARSRWFASVVCWVAVAAALYANLLHAQVAAASLEVVAAGFFVFTCWGAVTAVEAARA
ncbi:hypothetical protein [Paraburkholderia youngii]|uniref:hypothetical protein n=1 Tax=Paraburkholderia youngii TaxID=2782701 RepID=UPI003D1D093E